MKYLIWILVVYALFRLYRIAKQHGVFSSGKMNPPPPTDTIGKAKEPVKKDGDYIDYEEIR